MSNEELKECAQLFSDHYGNWSITAKRNPGVAIKLTPERLEKLMAPEGTSASLAYVDNELVGHALALRVNVEPYGYVSWVTQLVVHTDWRQKGVGKRLLTSIWSFSDDYAWGLVTANPYTVRTLEGATWRRCNPKSIHNRTDILKKVGQSIDYVRDREFIITSTSSKIDTDFEIEHNELERMIKRSRKGSDGESRPWRLGELSDGEEWLAFTFQSQKSTFDKNDLEERLNQSERVLQEAYERMKLDTNHKWSNPKHVVPECKYVFEIIDVDGTQAILDFGCGNGRHALQLARLGHHVFGIDFSKNLIEAAQKDAENNSLEKNLTFKEGDCRHVNLEIKFDVVFCVYDVIGSFADETENQKILANISKHLKPGGYVALSVMNMELTEHIAIYTGDVYEDPKLISQLNPSNTMQQTGDIFDPDYFLIDTNTNVIFRKEQFSEDGLLSSELIVRDRRYRRNEVIEICTKHGFEVIECRYVQAGRWDKALEAINPKAKEILYIGKKVN